MTTEIDEFAQKYCPAIIASQVAQTYIGVLVRVITDDLFRQRWRLYSLLKAKLKGAK
jgi:hypothetical protein